MCITKVFRDVACEKSPQFPDSLFVTAHAKVLKSNPTQTAGRFVWRCRSFGAVVRSALCFVLRCASLCAVLRSAPCFVLRCASFCAVLRSAPWFVLRCASFRAVVGSALWFVLRCGSFRAVVGSAPWSVLRAATLRSSCSAAHLDAASGGGAFCRGFAWSAPVIVVYVSGGESRSGPLTRAVDPETGDATDGSVASCSRFWLS
jgi:hypothetical protein